MIKYPLFVTIDTNIFDQCKYNYSEKGSLKRLARYVNSGKIKIVLSDIVVGEITSHVTNKAEEVAGCYKKLYKTLCKEYSNGFIQSLGIDITQVEHDKEELKQKAKSVLQSYLEELDYDVLDCESIELKQIINDYFSHTPPFENKVDKKSEFPDAIIAAEIKERFGNSDKVAIITNDNGVKKACGQSSNYLYFSSLPDLFDFMAREEESYNDAIIIINNQKERICKAIQEMLMDNHCIDVVGATYDRDGIISGHDYDEWIINRVSDLDIQVHRVEELQENKIYATLKAHAKIDVICYYDDYDNAAWDQEDETYIYVETKAFEEIHSANFPVQIILSNQGEIEDLDYYLLLGGDSRLTCDEIELEEIQPQKVDYEHICARP